MIPLIDIPPDNRRLGLKVAPEQQHYIADFAVMLARAYAYRKRRSRAFMIYNDAMPVGKGRYYDVPDMKCYDFSRLFIDERYQGKGYEKSRNEIGAGRHEERGKIQKSRSLLYRRKRNCQATL